ncbi:hypothetical protein [Thauera sp. SDU_THAU2]|uniref:hypothetical protein n=1 Tax=Thauera sp. SDU_THAU2 TaxID=3136633 RepID=UPI00311D2FD5
MPAELANLLADAGLAADVLMKTRTVGSDTTSLSLDVMLRDKDAEGRDIDQQLTHAIAKK